MAKKTRTTKPGIQSSSLRPERGGVRGVRRYGRAPRGGRSTAEALGGLAVTDEEFRALARAQEVVEKKYLLEPAAAVAAAAEEGPAGLGNVVGAGIGEKLIDGMPTGQLAVKVLVKEKLSQHEVSGEALISETVGDVPTDVDAVGDVTGQMFTTRLRPAPCGSRSATAAP